jgi:redox-sensitive bicupin YhaK (pirin superfamily)
MASTRKPDNPIVPLVLLARPRSIGASEVRRLLPHGLRRSVGPWVFFDHFGPAEIPAGVNTDVLPHPHIGLATVTWLFEGRSVHRDSLGVVQEIRPGAINWMSAGRGIVHSERAPEDERGRARRLHGLQLWLALPREREEDPPGFSHYPPERLPQVALPGVQARVLIGAAWGERSPVETPSETLYLEARVAPGGALPLPPAPERALYVVSGAVSLHGERLVEGEMAPLTEGATEVSSAEGALLVIIGGAPLDGPRHIWWNFVSSRKERIEEAAEQWRRRGFDAIPGDDGEFVPLPGG